MSAASAGAAIDNAVRATVASKMFFIAKVPKKTVEIGPTLENSKQAGCAF
jgi:hypothetical protein